MQEDKPQDAHVRVVKVRVFGRPKDFTTRFICESDVPRLSCGGLNLEILPEIFKMEGCFEVWSEPTILLIITELSPCRSLTIKSLNPSSWRTTYYRKIWLNCFSEIVHTFVLFVKKSECKILNHWKFGTTPDMQHGWAGNNQLSAGSDHLIHALIIAVFLYKRSIGKRRSTLHGMV